MIGSRDVTTGTDGKFLVQGITGRNGGLFAVRGGFTAARVFAAALADDLPEVLVPLFEACTVQGTVVDSGGLPVAGATISWRPLPAAADANRFALRHPEFDWQHILVFDTVPFPDPITGPDGRFRLSGLEPYGSVQLTARVPGAEPVFTAPAVLLDRPGAVVEVRLTPRETGSVAGTVTPACRGWSVRLVRDSGQGEAERVGEDGRYEFADALPGAARLELIRIPRAGSCTIRDGADGDPVTAAGCEELTEALAEPAGTERDGTGISQRDVVLWADANASWERVEEAISASGAAKAWRIWLAVEPAAGNVRALPVFLPVDRGRHRKLELESVRHRIRLELAGAADRPRDLEELYRWAYRAHSAAQEEPMCWTIEARRGSLLQPVVDVVNEARRFGVAASFRTVIADGDPAETPGADVFVVPPIASDVEPPARQPGVAVAGDPRVNPQPGEPRPSRPAAQNER